MSPFARLLRPIPLAAAATALSAAQQVRARIQTDQFVDEHQSRLRQDTKDRMDTLNQTAVAPLLDPEQASTVRLFPVSSALKYSTVTSYNPTGSLRHTILVPQISDSGVYRRYLETSSGQPLFDLSVTLMNPPAVPEQRPDDIVRRFELAQFAHETSHVRHNDNVHEDIARAVATGFDAAQAATLVRTAASWIARAGRSTPGAVALVGLAAANHLLTYYLSNSNSRSMHSIASETAVSNLIRHMETRADQEAVDQILTQHSPEEATRIFEASIFVMRSEYAPRETRGFFSNYPPMSSRIAMLEAGLQQARKQIESSQEETASPTVSA